MPEDPYGDYVYNGPVNGVRSCVERFAQRMERELRANAAKGDWLDRDMYTLVEEMHQHAGKLLDAIASGNVEAAREHAADVGNQAMFLSMKMDVK